MIKVAGKFAALAGFTGRIQQEAEVGDEQRNGSKDNDPGKLQKLSSQRIRAFVIMKTI